jgi:GLPGLI family protein
MKHIIAIFMINLSCFSQTYLANYIEKQINNENTFKDLPLEIKIHQEELRNKVHSYSLTYSGGISFYENTTDETINFRTLDNKKYTSANDKYFYFNFNENSMFFKTRFKKDYLYIEDKPIEFNWEITPDTLTINNTLCKKAKTNWGGFTTYAWYAESIPINAGPEKFNGLPGLIFKVQLPAREFTLIGIEKKENITEINNPKSNQNTISFEELVRLSEELINTLKKQNTSSNPNVIIIKKE